MTEGRSKPEMGGLPVSEKVPTLLTQLNGTERIEKVDKGDGRSE